MLEEGPSADIIVAYQSGSANTNAYSSMNAAGPRAIDVEYCREWHDRENKEAKATFPQ